MNEHMRKEFENIPTIDAFITQSGWRYIGKVYHKNKDTFPRNMLGA